MLVIELNTDNSLSAVPRIAPALSDILVFKWINENTQLTGDIEMIWQFSKGRLTFSFDTLPSDFIAGDKYEISIFNETTSAIIYLGKLIIVKEDTDIQNYTPSTQQTQRFKTKNQL